MAYFITFVLKETDVKILLTGATGRVGKEIVRVINTPDNRIALHGRNESKLGELADTLSNTNPLTVAYDLATPDAAESIIKKVIHYFQGLDVLINNAACFHFGNLIDIQTELLSTIIQTNLTSLIILTRLALPYLIASNRGTIINIASVAGQNYESGASTYCASKFGVFGFSGSLFEEVREQGVRVCTIAPEQLEIENLNHKNVIPPIELAQLVDYLIHYPGTKSFPTEITLRAI